METQFIKLNMTPTGINPCFHVSQYDIGRSLGFMIYNGSEVVDLDSYTCTIEATRSDGVAITASVATDDNVGTFEITATMTNKSDKYKAQFVIVDENSKRIASLPFDMDVVKAAMDENAESIEEDASLYQQYTEAVQGAIAEANADIQAEENARIAEVNAEATARANADTALQNNIDAEATARANAMNAEATARQTADNTLQGNINSEASTRASADSNLQTQINQIIAPSGEAPSAAEVQNARIGADGVTYSTLGDAIRNQVGELKVSLNDGYFELNNKFATGQFTEGSGITDSTLRIYCTEEIKIHKGDKVHAEAGTNTQPSVLIVDSTKTHGLQGSGWVTTNVNLISNYDGYLIVLARYPNNAEIAPSAYDAIVNVYNSFAYRLGEKVEENKNQIESELVEFEDDVKKGEIILSSDIIDTYASNWSSVDKCTYVGKGVTANQPYVEASHVANEYKMKVNTGFDTSLESSPNNLYFAFDYLNNSFVPFDCRKEYSFMVTNTNVNTKFEATIRLCDENKNRIAQFDVVLENNKRYTLTTDLVNVRYLMLYYIRGNTINVPFEIAFSDFICKTRYSTNLKTFYDGNTKLNKNSALSRYVGGRQIGTIPVSSNSYYSGLCMIHGDIFQFLTSDDAHVNYVKSSVFGINIESGDIYYKDTFTDNFGHVNTVSYCEATDSLIFGSGSGDENLPCKFYVYQGFYAAYTNGTRMFSISDCVEYDCSNISEFDGEIRMNAIWGDDNLLKYDQAILITNDNGTIRIVQLGKGTNQLSKGSYTASADGVFNGSFEIINTYTQDVGVIPTESINVCIQDGEYRDGVIYAGIGHNHFEMWKMKLNDADNSIVTEKVLKHFRNADGTVTTNGGIAGIEVTDEYLIMLLSPDYYYVYKL